MAVLPPGILGARLYYLPAASSANLAVGPAGICSRAPVPGWLANGHAFGASCPIIISRIEFFVRVTMRIEMSVRIEELRVGRAHVVSRHHYQST